VVEGGLKFRIGLLAPFAAPRDENIDRAPDVAATLL
jgi:hypothetical protein